VLFVKEGKGADWFMDGMDAFWSETADGTFRDYGGARFLVAAEKMRTRAVTAAAGKVDSVGRR
jgi:hypothetical protein